jgi:hypothetical protein
MKVALIAICFATIAFGACRREEPSYQPMKLGGDVHQTVRQ